MCMGESGGGDTDGRHHQQGQIKQTCDDQDFSCKEESEFQFTPTPLNNPVTVACIIESPALRSNELQLCMEVCKLPDMGNEWDVLIVGGGVAGCAAGVWLAKAGMKVLILEKHFHPRHHIGESLLPASMPILADLGISMDAMLNRYQPKYGARFCDSATQRYETFGFAGADQTPPSFQVSRAEFDAELKSLAVSAGCRYQDHCQVVSWKAQADHAEVFTAQQQIHSGRFLIIAAGRSRLNYRGADGVSDARDISNRFGHLAVYNYFPPFPPALDDERSYITLHLISDGWIWCIPLRDGSTSIGVVLKQNGVRQGITHQEQFEQALQRCPSLWNRLSNVAPLDEYRTAADYSYRPATRYGPGWVKIGDAGGFLDPIFSSGVHLAINSAQLASQAVIQYLNHNDPSQFETFNRHMDWAEGVFEAFIERFYHRDLVQQLFFADYRPAHMKAAITDLLAGRVWDPENPVIAMLAPKSAVSQEMKF